MRTPAVALFDKNYINTWLDKTRLLWSYFLENFMLFETLCILPIHCQVIGQFKVAYTLSILILEESFCEKQEKIEHRIALSFESLNTLSGYKPALSSEHTVNTYIGGILFVENKNRASI